jgi:hypothetical protein
MKKTLWRAAQDDYIDTGYSFATTRANSEVYLDNPGFGGATIYRAKISVSEKQVVDLQGLTVRELAKSMGFNDPGAIDIDEWLPRTPDAITELRSQGFLWAMVEESFPENSTTWIWLGSGLDDEPELEAV